MDRIKQGDIWAIDLRPTTGYEIAKIRPCVVISSSTFNDTSSVIIILPISSQIPKIIGPERILLSKEGTKLKKDSIILVNHIRSLDKTRFSKKIGTIPKEKIAEIENSIKTILGFTSEA